MILDARQGHTARGLRPYTTRAELAYFLGQLREGQELEIEEFRDVHGAPVPLRAIQQAILFAKAPDAVIRTSIADGALIVRKMK